MSGHYNASSSEMPQSNPNAELRKNALAILARIIAKDMLRKAITEKEPSNHMHQEPPPQPLNDDDSDKNEGNG